MSPAVSGYKAYINDLHRELNSFRVFLTEQPNYILTKMSAEGADFSEVLADAKAKGYAESNPQADIEGLDASRRFVILAAIASL